jgi:hypothetical protein
LVIHAKVLSFGATGLHAAGAEGDYDEAQRHTRGVGPALYPFEYLAALRYPSPR